MNRLLLILWSLGPMLWQLYTSFRPNATLTGNPMQGGWTLEHYQALLGGNPPFWRYLLNSGVVGLSSTLLTLVVAVPCAYGLSRLGRKTARNVNVLVAIAAAFPYVLLFLALLQLARDLHLGNNLLALSLPYTALSLPLAILLLQASFRDIPPELEEAARLEGLGLWQRLRWVLLPLMAPAIASASLLIFLFCWNEYPVALTWLSRADLLTLAPAMARIAGSSVFTVPYGGFAAATVLGSIPLIVLVLVFQRQIVSGLTQGASTGCPQQPTPMGPREPSSCNCSGDVWVASSCWSRSA